MSCYPETDIHSRDKVKVLLDLSNYATKKKLDHATGVDISNLSAKKDFIALKAEVGKLGNNKLANVTTSSNQFSTLKTRVNNLEKKFQMPVLYIT